MSARCFQYNPTEASSFGDCCDTLGVVPKPWWWYLVLTLPVELTLAFFRATEDGSVGERKTARENVVFSVVTVLALTPIVARLVAPLFDDSYEKVCDGGWNCYEAFVFTFSNSSALLTCLTLWVRLKFKRFFPAMVRVARLWFANPVFSYDVSVVDLEFFEFLRRMQIKVLRAEYALFGSFGDEELMDAESREGTSMALEHSFALLVICAGGALTHVVPAAAAYIWIFGPMLLVLLVSHALRVGPLRDRGEVWLIVNIPLAVVGIAVHAVLTVLGLVVAFCSGILYPLIYLVTRLVRVLADLVLYFYYTLLDLADTVTEYCSRSKVYTKELSFRRSRAMSRSRQALGITFGKGTERHDLEPLSALDTLKQLLRQLKRLALFDALGNLVVLGTAFSLLAFSMAANYGLLLHSGAPYIEVPWVEVKARDSRRLIDCYSSSTEVSLDLRALGIIELLITAFGFLMSIIIGVRFIVLFVSDPGLFLAGAEQLQTAVLDHEDADMFD